VTPDLVGASAAVHSPTLEREDVPSDRLIEQSQRQVQNSRRLAWLLFDAFLTRVARSHDTRRDV
jgi:hypothetical protein